MNKCFIGDCRDTMTELIAQGLRVQMCVTSPPYWGLRDYGVPGQLGLEPTPDEYVVNMVEVFKLVRELLADDGCIWVNLGDSYANDTKWGGTTGGKHAAGLHGEPVGRGRRNTGLKAKDLCGIPWRVAFALQADGWYLRQDIIWSKPNPMPESVTDRCTKAHEYIFLLSKRERYYYDAKAIAEPVSQSMLDQIEQGYNGSATKDYGSAGAQDPSDVKSRILKRTSWRGSDFDTGKTGEMMDTRGHLKRDDTPRNDGNRWNENNGRGFKPSRSGNNKERKPATARSCPNEGTAGSIPWEGFNRNKRSVWTVTTKPFPGAHFATFPPALIEPCILAGSKPGDIVLDPFFGSGTTGEVAQRLGRQWIGCELNEDYERLQQARTAQQGMVLA